MAKGIIYMMISVVPGLIKIGKTKTENFERRMYQLEHDGYRNVTGLHRTFAIEVEDYDDKEIMLHTIFEKSRLSDTELFALDPNTAIQLLSSLEGTVVYPKSETKTAIFTDATELSQGKSIPNGIYKLKKTRRSEGGKPINAKAIVENGKWTLMKGSLLGIAEGTGVSRKAKETRSKLVMDSEGRLLEDAELGECFPSLAGTVVVNQGVNGWTEWKNENGDPIEIYKNKETVNDD